MKTTTAFVVCLALILLSSSAAAAQPVRTQQHSLHGLTSFEVVVENMSSDAEVDGLTKDDLQAAVKDKMRQAGFNLSPAGAEYLYVNVTLTFGSGIYIYCADLQLRQPVRLEREPELAVPDAVTWETSLVGAVQAAELPEAIETVVLSQVDDFITAFTAENPGLLQPRPAGDRPARKR